MRRTTIRLLEAQRLPLVAQQRLTKRGRVARQPRTSMRETVRWAAFLPSMVISSTFLFFNVRGVVAESPKGLAFTTPFMGCVVGAHAVFGLLLKVYWVS